MSSIVLVPIDERAAIILRGRYLDPENPVQIIVPSNVIGALVDRIFGIKSLLDAVTLIVGGAAFAAVGLAIFLSYRLRAREMQTAFKIGAGRGMILRLLVAETATLLCLACTIAFFDYAGRSEQRQGNRGMAVGHLNGTNQQRIDI